MPSSVWVYAVLLIVLLGICAYRQRESFSCWRYWRLRHLNSEVNEAWVEAGKFDKMGDRKQARKWQRKAEKMEEEHAVFEAAWFPERRHEQ